MDPILEVDGLITEFQTPDGTVRAVDSVSLQVHRGEVVGLVGESGCGKSVTALSLMRLVSPPGRIVAGSVRLKGADILQMTDPELRAVRGASIAMIFQDPMTSLNPALTIGRQISESLELHLGMSGAAARKRTIDLLALVGIPNPGERVKQYPHQFSGGMRQRAMIATALACNPDLIIADEITTALDMTIQAQILELLKSVSKEFGTAIIIVTHDLGVVAGMANRVTVMYAGRIVEQAPTVELFGNPRMPYTWGLLRSSPRLDADRRSRLTPIEGLPPDLLAPPPGCRFEPRCAYRRDVCRATEAPLTTVPHASRDHAARCWGTQDTPEGGWLVGLDWRSDETSPGKAAPDPVARIGFEVAKA